MKRLWTHSARGLLFVCLLTLKTLPAAATENPSENLIIHRLGSMSAIIETDFSAQAKGYVNAYLYHRYDTELLLGKTVQYFPIFEFYLTQYNLPEELKFLPVIESRLRPWAYSTAGAGGMWQFTIPTAQFNGLKVNRYVDERRDPHKSTRAALKYLAYLHDQFDSWELALAAYNCGEGKVRKAIERAGTSNLKQVLKLLPPETQEYIPRFLAAQYICRFYPEHGLQPALPDADLLNTRTVMVYKGHSMFTLAHVTGVQLSIIKELNPAYYDNYIPPSLDGNFLTVPQRSFILLLDYLGNTEGWNQFDKIGKTGYVATSWIVQRGDTLEKLARITGTTRSQIMRWNNLRSPELFPGQVLRLYYAVPMVGVQPGA